MSNGGLVPAARSGDRRAPDELVTGVLPVVYDVVSRALNGHADVEAARWLDDDEHVLLALWWQESTGVLTRAELAGALGVGTGHAAVRVKWMKDGLETARLVVRALHAGTCPELAELTSGWDGAPGTEWRKRLARHTRDCGHCAPRRRRRCSSGPSRPRRPL